MRYYISPWFRIHVLRFLKLSSKLWNFFLYRLECFVYLGRILTACSCRVGTSATATATDCCGKLYKLSCVCACLYGFLAADSGKCYLSTLGRYENSNDIVRFFFPKGFDFRTVTDEDIQFVEDLINNRPRKCLGWKTPAEILEESVALGWQSALAKIFDFWRMRGKKSLLRKAFWLTAQLALYRTTCTPTSASCLSWRLY